MPENITDYYKMSPIIVINTDYNVQCIASLVSNQTPVVQKLDSAIHRINPYPVDNTIGFPNTYPLDGNLSGG